MAITKEMKPITKGGLVVTCPRCKHKFLRQNDIDYFPPGPNPDNIFWHKGWLREYEGKVWGCPKCLKTINIIDYWKSV